jgi:CRISPR system Cascade subunit CasE
MHAAVLAGFPDARPSQEGRVLCRVDTYQTHRVLLYAVSPDKPDFTHLAEQAGWPTTTAWDTRGYDGLLDSLRDGQRWHFRLTANPVHSARRAEWTETKPLAHVTVAQQLQWLLDRAEGLGFRIPGGKQGDGEEGEPDVAVVDRSVRRFSRGEGRVTVATATFEGHLEITDPAALRKALTFGIGRAKSYGCGLLTLAPLAGRNPPQ